VRVDRQIGLEATPDEYLAMMVGVFREVRRVLRPDGTCWVNMGDSYAGTNTMGRGAGDGTRVDGRGVPFGPSMKHLVPSEVRSVVPSGAKPKDLLLMPARLALALQADGWWVRSDIIWHKPNPMPESVTDRPTSAHEHVFLLTKSARYWYDADAVREEPSSTSHGWLPAAVAPATDKYSAVGNGHDGKRNAPNPAGRNLRNVWTIATHSFAAAHFATYPPALAERCIKAGTKRGDTVLDPFAGAGTTLLVADRLQRDAIGIELNPEYLAMTQARIEGDAGLFASVEEAPPQSLDLPSAPHANGKADITLLDYLEREIANTDVELCDAR
jgi:DNA modification methylase